MASKRKSEINFSNKDEKSESDDEMGDFVLQKSKKKKICLDSGSESESSFLDQNNLKNGEELKESSGDEDKPISNIIKKNTSKIKHRVSGTSDEDEEPISNITKKKAFKIKDKLKKMKPCSSDSSEDEPLANKHKKSFANSNSQSTTKDLHSESEDEVAATSDKGKISQIATVTKLGTVHTSSSSSDDEPLAVRNKNSSTCSSKSKESGIFSGEIRPKNDSDDDDDDEPISNILQKEASNIRDVSREMKSSSSSEDEPLANKHRKSTSCNDKTTAIDHHSDSNDGSEVSSDEDSLNETIKSSKTNRRTKTDSSLNDSEDEFLAVKSKSAKHKPRKQNKETKNKSVTGDLSSDDVEKSSDSSQNVLKKKVDKKKVSKDKNSSNGKIEHLKKYLRIAGIHIKSYDKLFEDCKSIKSKVEKLLGLLHEKGLKGRPTIEKCKKLKKKIETKKEIAELDLSNIIKSEGRPKRGTGGKIEKIQNVENSPAGKKFMRLQDIIDSEESD